MQLNMHTAWQTAFHHATQRARVLGMRKTSFAGMNCSIAQTLEIIGEWWTLLIIRDCFLGIRRFDDFVERLGIARNVLTSRLDTLVDAGILERRAYDEGRGRYDYLLTDKGRALWPVLTAVRQWGDEWVLGEGHEPMVLEHKACNHLTNAVLVCDHCHEPLDARAVRAIPGPGASAFAP
jgi:DNA-binding HxlR family transcriptional regulator